MPVYEYACGACEHRFEQLQRMSEDPVRVCPECGAPEVRKLVSKTSFVLKGGGWYKDHYGLKSDDSSASESEPSTAPKTSPSSSGTEASSSEKSTSSGDSTGSSSSGDSGSSSSGDSGSSSSGDSGSSTSKGAS